MKPLLPKRHSNHDFFITDFGDFIPKSDIASMEHPLFTLSTKPDIKERYYEHNGNSVTITPSGIGLATIHDKDILIYCISQLMIGVNKSIDEAKAQGIDEYIAPSKALRFTAYDLLASTNRQVSGEGYKKLEQAFKRLNGMLIQTSIRTNNQEINEGFHILEKVKTIYDDPNSPKRKMVALEVTLSDWLYNSILGCEVLSINRDYFRLRKPLERRVYELARKHCGAKRKWTIGLDVLLKKSGSSSKMREFKRMLDHIVQHNHLPDYKIEIEGKNVNFYYKNYRSQSKSEKGYPLLKPDTFEKAKKVANRLDVYQLEEEWHVFWDDTGRPKLDSPEAAFIAFCKNRAEKVQS